MKYACLLVAAMAATALVGCNMENNGETPPPHELPTPFPTQSAAPAPSTAPAPSSPGSTPAAATTTATAKAASGPYRYDAAKGKQLYAATCSVCHKATGVGMPGTFPPLKGNPVVNNPDATEHIRTVLDGAHGAKTIQGVKYDGVMPPLGSGLSNEDIANLINYERSSWGNHAKHTTPAQVAKVRAANKGT